MHLNLFSFDLMTHDHVIIFTNQVKRSIIPISTLCSYVYAKLLCNGCSIDTNNNKISTIIIILLICPQLNYLQTTMVTVIYHLHVQQ